MNEQIKLIEEQICVKKHIVITGTRGSGKTTLLNELRDELGLLNGAPGLVTWAEPGKAVYMRTTSSLEYVMVGEYNPNSLSKENRMRPVPDGFDVQGIALLESLMNDASEWVTIDEIGYLEGSSSAYIGKLDELFEKKRVIAVVRKQDIKHINDVVCREDAFVIDLDS